MNFINNKYDFFKTVFYLKCMVMLIIYIFKENILINKPSLGKSIKNGMESLYFNLKKFRFISKII